MPKTGLDALLRPEDSVFALIDPCQFATFRAVNNVVGLAKEAKLSGAQHGPAGLWCLIKGIQDVFPQQRPAANAFNESP